LRKTKHTGWANVSSREILPDDPTGILNSVYRRRRQIREWVADWKTLAPADPLPTVTVHPLWAVIDFEMMSHKRLFPKAANARDVLMVASIVSQRTGKPETLQALCIYLGTIAPDASDADLNGVPIRKIACRTERDLLVAFQDALTVLDPDIISGYNIEGFDLPYFADRLVLPNGLKMSNFGRIEKELPALRDRLREMSKREEKQMGVFFDRQLTVPGRIVFDLMPYIKRTFSLRRYNLETVSQTILKTGKLDMPAKVMFAIYANVVANPTDLHAQQEMNRVVNYCAVDSILVMRILEKLNLWVELYEFSAIMGVPMSQLYSRGQQIRVFSLIFDAAFNDGVVIDKQTWEIIQAAGAVVQDPVAGIHDHVNVLDFSSLYPSIIMGYNICFTTLIPKTRYREVTKADCNVFEIDQMEAVNPDQQSEDIYLEDDEDDSDDDEAAPDTGLNDAGLVRINVTEVKKGKKANMETHVVHRDIRFIRPNIKKGLLPRILERLVGERKHTRKVEQVKYEPHSFEWEKLEKRQLALKVTANALYGFLGCQTNGMLPLPEGFICVTARGRELITTVRKYILDNDPNAIVVFGDTDSLGWKGTLKGAEAYVHGKALAKLTATMFPPPIAMEFEKMTRIIVFRKKMYAYLKYLPDGVNFEMSEHTGRPEIILKGVRSARRDNCAFQVGIYNQGIDGLLNLEPTDLFIRLVAEQMRAFLDGKVPLADLAINTNCGMYASDSKSTMKTLMDTMALLGKPIQSGDRVDWVVRERTDEDTSASVGPRMLTLEWVNELDPEQRPPLDRDYYLGKLSKTYAIVPIFAVGAWAEGSARRQSVLTKTTLEYVGPDRKKTRLTSFENPTAFFLLAVRHYTKTDVSAMLERLCAWLIDRITLARAAKWDARAGTPLQTIESYWNPV
jgi:DNA polymerase elongation subunit (family B)